MAVSGSGIVLCRLAAVFLLVRGIQQLGLTLPVASSPLTLSWQATFPSIFVAAVPIVTALVVWRLAPIICAINGENSDPAIDGTDRATELIAVGTFLVGLYALLFGLTSAVSVEISLWAQNVVNENTPVARDTAWLDSIRSRAPYATQIALGVGLMLGRNGLALVFSKVRYAGTGSS